MRSGSIHTPLHLTWAAPVVAIAAIAAIAAGIQRDGEPPPAPAAVQAGVLGDGFVAALATGAGHRVVEVTPDGKRRTELSFARAGDARIVGSWVGPAAAWQDGNQLHLTRIRDGESMGHWGKSVRRLCDGAASNDQRFAVGWLESDGRVWMVHGPVQASDARELDGVEVSDVATTKTDWCGVASAEQLVTLLWRDGNYLRMNACTTKRCSGYIGSLKLDPRAAVLGFGCLRSGCLVGIRDADGKAAVGYVTDKGKLAWTRPIDTRAPVAIVGVASGGFAVGVVTPGGVEVTRYDQKDGAATRVWQSDVQVTPALAWASGRLAIAYDRGGDLVTETVALAR